MKSRWVRAVLAVLGIVGAMAAGVLTAIFTAEHVQTSAPAEPKPLMQIEPQELLAHQTE